MMNVCQLDKYATKLKSFLNFLYFGGPAKTTIIIGNIIKWWVRSRGWNRQNLWYHKPQWSFFLVQVSFDMCGMSTEIIVRSRIKRFAPIFQMNKISPKMAKTIHIWSKWWQVREIWSKSYCQPKILLATRLLGFTTFSWSGSNISDPIWTKL